MSVNNATSIPAEVNNFYDRTLLLRVIPRFLHMKFGQVRDIPRNSGTQTIKFRRYSNLTAALTPLTDGITPVGNQLSTTEITTTVSQYGDFITITDVLDYQTQDPVLTEAAQILGDQAANTLDQLTRNVLTSGTNVYYGGTETARNQILVTDVMTTTLILKVVRLLKNNNAMKITTMVDPTTGISTLPLNACFVAICHPNVSYTLKQMTGWVPIEKYSAQKDIMDGEIGAYDEVRFIESTNAQVFPGAGAGSPAADVYATLFFAMQAYGVTRISSEALQNIIKPLGSAGTADPLEQRATTGWKSTFTAIILNNNFMVRVETGVPA